MSRKNIARTAIEGGRATHCREAEHNATVNERRTYKHYCRVAVNDPEIDEPWENAFAEPYETGRKSRDFDDKLSPVKRWLESHVGKPWDKVRSEVVEKFPGNTLAGRHILRHVDGFVLQWADMEARFKYRWRRGLFPGELYVDARGFLRQAPLINKKDYYRMG